MSAISGRTRTWPSFAPRPLRKKRRRRSSSILATRSAGYTAARARFNTFVSMSVASTVQALARGPSASTSVMAMEYGSSPVEAAQHQTDTGPPRFFAKSASIGK
ncbi:hypothetical protein D3C85_1646390 [compost metagenome]